MKIKRFKNGIQPQKNNGSFELLLLAGLINIFAMTLIYTDNAQSTLPEILIVFLLFCGLGLIIWWKKYITNNYREKISQRNVDTLETRTLALEQENEILRQQNEILATIIHRDNKIIPAMLLTVETIARKNQSSEINDLLAHLQDLTKNRKNVICDYQKDTLPSTGDIILDGIIQLLNNKAKEQGSEFNFECKGKFLRFKDEIERVDQALDAIYELFLLSKTIAAKELK